MEVTGLPGLRGRDTLNGLRLNADVERTGEFSCSNEQFNRIQEMCGWTFLSNLFSVKSDCPHRERVAYGGDVAATVMNQKTFPGWGYMLANGATTLWEHWKGSDNTYSHNHPMFGSVSQWLYQWLGGIQPAPDAVGFDRVIIRPQIVPGLDWVRCRHRSVRGEIVSDWRREGDRLAMEIEVPVNTTALVYVPVPGGQPEQVEESGRPAAQSSGVEFVRLEGGAAVYRVESGRYRFTVRVRSAR